MRPIFVIAASLLALSACTSAPTRYFTLLPPPQLGANGQKTSVVERIVMLGPVTIPAALDQREMAITLDGDRVDLREAERWSAPFREEFTSALAARLGVLLPHSTVAFYRQSAGSEANVKITVDVSRFELGPGTRTALDVLWTVKDDDGMQERHGRTQVAVPAREASYSALVAAQGKALDELARALAANLR